MSLTSFDLLLELVLLNLLVLIGRHVIEEQLHQSLSNDLHQLGKPAFNFAVDRKLSAHKLNNFIVWRSNGRDGVDLLGLAATNIACANDLLDSLY